jgi:hypothetical protein
MFKKIYFILPIITFEQKIFANNSFYNFDNNIKLIINIGNINSSYNYNDFISGININILSKKNLWLDLNIFTASNLQNNIAKLNRISTTNLLSTKIGQAFINYNDKINLIPYIGVEYTDSNQIFHTDSKPQNYYTTNNIGFNLGIHPEFLITKNLKFTFDNNFNYTQDDGILYNKDYNDLYHEKNDNYYYTINIDLQYTLQANLNLGLNYTNYIKLNNNEENKSNQYYGIYLGYNFLN